MKRHTALVTGASTGIGKATAVALGRAGFDIALHAEHPNAGDPDGVRRYIESLGVKVTIHFEDLAEPTAPARIVAEAWEEHGTVDVLVNNAAIKERRSLSTIDARYLDSLYEVNLRAPILLAGEFTNRLVSAQEPGVVVNVSSIRAVSVHVDDVMYGACKAALERATRSMALEFAADGIRVNAVAPGAIDTSESVRSTEADRSFEAVGSTIPMGRPGSTEDVASAIAWLCSSQAAYVTGTVLTVDGGLLLPAPPEPFEQETK